MRDLNFYKTKQISGNEEIMLELINVKKSYGNTSVIEDLSFKIEKGEVLGFIGANGAGKSTTVSMIATLAKPDEGSILLNGEDIVKNPKAMREKLGYVPQDIALYETLSCEDNLKFFGRAYNVTGELFKQRKEEVCSIIGFTKDMLKKKVKDCSGGMKRRINIGVALLHNPELVIMDEPTVGIDIVSRNQIIEGIRRLAQNGTSVIYVGHYMEEVEAVCDKICLLKEGRCAAFGTPDELLNGPSGRISLEDFYVKNS